MPKILIVEDDLDLVRALQVRLGSSGYQVLAASDGVHGTMAARKEGPDLVILDLGLPGGDGYTLLHRFQELIPDTPVIVLTAGDPTVHEERTLAEGAFDFIQKPADNEVLLKTMEAALSKKGTFRTAGGE